MFLELVRARWLRWAFVGAFTGAGVFVFLFFFNPIKYSAHTSLYIASTDAWSKFIGLSRTRMVARRTEEKVHLQEWLSLKTKEQAVDTIMKGITVNDIGKEGIVNFTFTMAGPAQLAPGASNRREETARRVAEVVDAYVVAFQEYLKENTVDGDTLRLQQMQIELEKAKKDYKNSTEKLTNFIHTHKMPMGYSPDMYFTTDYGSAKGIEKSIGTEINGETKSLYASRKALEAEIGALRASDAMRRTSNEQMLDRLRTLPSEDLLLTQARNAANDARVQYDTLAKQLGPDHPQTVIARDKQEATQTELDAQVNAIRKHNTTEDALVQAKLSYLTNKYETTKRQIIESEKDSHLSYETMIDLEKARSNVALNLEILKVLSVQVATQSLERLSANNRMHVLDPAEIPDSGSPGPKMLLIFTALLSLFATFMAVTVDWLRLTYRAYGLSKKLENLKTENLELEIVEEASVLEVKEIKEAA